MIDIPKAAYIHIPFCVSKCWYCDFNSYSGMDSFFDSYACALMSEIRQVRKNDQSSLQTVYFGGGTPTVLPAEKLEAILGELRCSIGIDEDAEVTLEANPGTIDANTASRLRHAGFNRISLGVQSFDDAFLRTMGRIHSRDQATAAYNTVREEGFCNVGVDLIFALPGQGLGHWSDTLDAALQLKPPPEHLSLYELSIEEGTRFAELLAAGRLEPGDEDLRLRMYELTISKLSEAGFEHYEVSNFARPGFRSRHNMVYWMNGPYYGFGAGATSYMNKIRSRRISDPRKYIDAISFGGEAVEFSESLDCRERLGETIIQGLRMLEGVDLVRTQRRLGLDPMAEFAAEIESLVRRGLVELADSHLRVTHSGLLLLNDVSQEFVTCA